MDLVEQKRLPGERVTRPTMELLTYSWRYVLGRMGLFVALSGLLIASVVATSLVGTLGLTILGIDADSMDMGLREWLMSVFVNSAMSSFIVLPIWAGIYGVVFRMLDNDSDAIKGFAFMQHRYGNVVLLSLMTTLPTTVLTIVLRSALPGTVATVASSLVVLFFGAAVMLSLPAMVRYDLRPFDAILYSIRRFGSRPMAYLGFYLATALLSLSGVLACGIGVLFTMGVWFVAPALLMLEPPERAEN